MGAGTYAFIDTGVIGTDEIKVALIYKPAAVTPVGDYEDHRLGGRPALRRHAQPAVARPDVRADLDRRAADGRRQPPEVEGLRLQRVGDPDTGDGQGNCNVTRTNAAEALVDWLATDPTGSGDHDVLLIGDMNSYTFEDPITAFTDGGFTNLVAAVQRPGRLLVRVQRRVGLPRPRARVPVARGPDDRRRRTGTSTPTSRSRSTTTSSSSPPTRSTRSTTRARTALPTTTRSSSASRLNGPPTVAVAAGGTCSSTTDGGTMNLTVAGTRPPPVTLTVSASSSNHGARPGRQRRARR